MSGDYERAIEDVAVWLETRVRLGTLAARVRLADQLRDGSWRDIPVRATAHRDVAETRANHRLWYREPLTRGDVEALTAQRRRRQEREAREARAMQRMAEAFGEARP